VAAAEVVQADETSLKMQQPNKRGFVWTFLSEKLIAYVFSSSRSGETPSTVLGSSTGTLVVDMYTGYNEVTSTGGRTRAACLAHARRRLTPRVAAQAPTRTSGEPPFLRSSD
jgi:transposase